MKTEIDGLFIVDKPDGVRSLEMVKEVKRRLGAKKAGHIGTLDSFATGVLPIAINEGTKLVPFLEEGTKEYEAILKLGEETTTDDLTGEVISRTCWNQVTPEQLHSVFQTFLGTIVQIPPMFSAVKVKGRPLYRLARKGIEVERKGKEVTIFNLHIEDIDLPRVFFEVSCSKGTYIRTLARDIGKKIGCGAHLIRLRRVRSGPFTLERAVPWKDLRSRSGLRELWPWLIPLEAALPSLPEVVGDRRLVTKVRFGREMMVGDLSSQTLPAFEKGEWLKITSPEDGLVAILKSEIRGVDMERANPEVIAFRPLRVFQSRKGSQNVGRA